MIVSCVGVRFKITIWGTTCLLWHIYQTIRCNNTSNSAVNLLCSSTGSGKAVVSYYVECYHNWKLYSISTWIWRKCINHYILFFFFFFSNYYFVLPYSTTFRAINYLLNINYCDHKFWFQSIFVLLRKSFAALHAMLFCV